MAFSKVILNGTTLMDVTQDTVTSDTLKTGSTATAANGEKITGVMQAGRPFDKNADICFWDYDGTPVYSCSFAEIQEMDSLPDAPDHSQDEVPLQFDCWNWSLADLKALDYPMDVGACYETVDGKMHWYYRLTNHTGLTCSFTTSYTNDVIIDWGDGSEPEHWGSQTDNGANPTHTYSAPGTYHCTWEGSGRPSSQMRTEGNNALVGTFYCGSQNSAYWLGSYWQNTFNACNVEALVGFKRTVLAVNSYYLKAYIQYANLPSGDTASSNLCQSARSLRLISFPNVTYAANSYFCSGSAIERWRRPSGVSHDRLTCSGAKDLTFWNSEASGGSALNSCTSLRRVVIIGTIGSGSFQNAPIEEIWCGLDEPPTLTNANSFASISPSALIHVKASALTAFQEATNWSTYADYMVGDWNCNPDR